MKQKDYIHQLKKLFEPLSRSADPWPIHWLGQGDQGSDYCLPCCKAVAKHARRRRLIPSACVDGGWDDARESDGPSYCHGCSRLLGYSLSQEGLSVEIDHWLTNGDPSHLTPDDAYQIEAILDASLYYGKDDDLRDAIVIAERMSPLSGSGGASL